MAVLEIAEAGIDAFDVGLQHRQLVPGDGVEVPRNPRAETVHAVFDVGLQRALAEQSGQLASSGAPHQVHLEVAFLRVHVAQCTHGIGLAGGLNGDHAELVALDRHRRGQPGQGQLTIELRQTAAQQPPDGDDGQQERDQQRQCEALHPGEHRDPRDGSPRG
jgi:hypothetical protein